MNQRATPLCRMFAEREVSEALGIPVSTLRNWRSIGEGPRFVKLGKRCVRYREDDLQAFANGNAR